MRFFTIFAVLAVVPLTPAVAQEATQSSQVIERVFTEVERQMIEEYFRGRGQAGDTATGDEDRYHRDRDRDRDRDHEGDRDWDDDDHGKHKNKHKAKNKGKHGDMPPGLAKRDDLPPGLEKHVERWGRLPPGLEKRELPYELRDRLGHHDDLTDTQIVGDDVVLVDTATGIILDILRGVANAGQQ